MSRNQDNITLSPKYGLNSSINVCFFCGEDKNELIIPGRLKGDAEAPQRAIYDYEPCEKCKEKMKKGIVMIGVTEIQPEDERPEIQEGLYPTGRWCLVTRNYIKRVFKDCVARDVCKAGKCFVSEQVLTKIIGKAK